MFSKRRNNYTKLIYGGNYNKGPDFGKYRAPLRQSLSITDPDIPENPLETFNNESRLKLLGGASPYDILYNSDSSSTESSQGDDAEYEEEEAYSDNNEEAIGWPEEKTGEYEEENTYTIPRSYYNDYGLAFPINAKVKAFWMGNWWDCIIWQHITLPRDHAPNRLETFYEVKLLTPPSWTRGRETRALRRRAVDCGQPKLLYDLLRIEESDLRGPRRGHVSDDSESSTNDSASRSASHSSSPSTEDDGSSYNSSRNGSDSDYGNEEESSSENSYEKSYINSSIDSDEESYIDSDEEPYIDGAITKYTVPEEERDLMKMEDPSPYYKEKPEFYNTYKIYIGHNWRERFVPGNIVYLDISGEEVEIEIPSREKWINAPIPGLSDTQQPIAAASPYFEYVHRRVKAQPINTEREKEEILKDSFNKKRAEMKKALQDNINDSNTESVHNLGIHPYLKKLDEMKTVDSYSYNGIYEGKWRNEKLKDNIKRPSNIALGFTSIPGEDKKAIFWEKPKTLQQQKPEEDVKEKVKEEVKEEVKEDVQEKVKEEVKEGPYAAEARKAALEKARMKDEVKDEDDDDDEVKEEVKEGPYAAEARKVALEKAREAKKAWKLKPRTRSSRLNSADTVLSSMNEPVPEVPDDAPESPTAPLADESVIARARNDARAAMEERLNERLRRLNINN
ncbi:MAG: hypothetical protein CML47_10385 [Rhodobacteraceae bacterium]|nr:MAG: hypothetical protein CML47_10385 [Paracoccaceae bacterium]|tara:strand:- start:10975 stop:13008 length:2034 start_codon:yes stop_codon:yes gene_type:complete